MEVYECLKTRLTIRSFRPDPVPDELITRILEAGRWAPSSRNRQPWHFIVVTNRDILQQIGSIATSGSFIGQAPMAIAILMQGAERPDLDAGRALQQMEMLAWSEGLGTCFVGLSNGDQNQRVKEILGIPEDVDLITVLPFGYRLSHGKGARQKSEAADVKSLIPAGSASSTAVTRKGVSNAQRKERNL